MISKYLFWAAKKQSKEAIYRTMDVVFIQSPLFTLQEHTHFWRTRACKCMSSNSKTTARCCRLIINITWRGAVCKTISSRNLLTDAWTEALFANWHQVGKALEQISVLLALTNAAHSILPSLPSAQMGKHKVFLETTKSLKISHPSSYFHHCLQGLPPQWITNSEYVTTWGRFFLICSVPNLYLKAASAFLLLFHSFPWFTLPFSSQYFK